MAVETHLFSNGSYRKAKRAFTFTSGNWIELKEVWHYSAGAWRMAFRKGLEIIDTITNGYDYNVYNVAQNTGQWDGATPVFATITLNGTLGASVSTTYDWQQYVNNYADLPPVAASYNGGAVNYGKFHWYTYGLAEGRTMPLATAAPFAFSTGNLPAGSQVTLIINPGSVLTGAGGVGGYGGVFNVRVNDSSYKPTTGGMPGGHAIYAGAPLTIINNGLIGGGGGGGAGGSGASGSEAYDDPGSAGGGGAGNIAGVQGGSYRSGSFIGQNGTALTGGFAGVIANQGSGQWAGAKNGGKGGDLGQPGVSSPAGGGPGSSAAGFPGGAAGLAVQGISNVTWQVLGDVRGATA
jgi:hypothetical protein